mgnify:CR=1 FL=1
MKAATHVLCNVAAIPRRRIGVNLSAFQGIGRPLRAVAAAILAASEAGILPAGATSDDCSMGQDAPLTGRLEARRYMTVLLNGMQRAKRLPILLT